MHANQGNLSGALNTVRNNWEFDETTYPVLALLKAGTLDRRKFALAHVLKHLSWALGRLQKQSEKGDHGEEMDFDLFEVVIPRMLISTLALAALVDMSEQALAAAIDKWAEEKRQAKTNRS